MLNNQKNGIVKQLLNGVKAVCKFHILKSG